MSQATKPVVVISGFGMVSHFYEGSSPLERLDEGAVTPAVESPLAGVEIPIGRLGRLRRHPFRERFDKMSQLDAFGQYGFVATGHALDDASIPAPDELYERTGVIMGTCFGCQEANFQFDQFTLDPEEGIEGARPVVFKNTVDNVPAGWISVAYRLRGVNATFISGPGAGAEAMMAARAAIEAGRARQVVCGGAERLIDIQIASLHTRGALPEPYPAEGAAVLVLEEAAAAVKRGHEPRAELVGDLRYSTPDPSVVGKWLTELSIEPQDLALVSIVATSAAKASLARQELEEVGIGGPFHVESELTGEMFSAQAPLAMSLLCSRLEVLGDEQPIGLLYVCAEPGDAMLFLVRRP